MSWWADQRTLPGQNKMWCQRCDEMRPRAHVKLETIVREDGSVIAVYTCPEDEDA